MINCTPFWWKDKVFSLQWLITNKLIICLPLTGVLMFMWYWKTKSTKNMRERERERERERIPPIRLITITLNTVGYRIWISKKVIKRYFLYSYSFITLALVLPQVWGHQSPTARTVLILQYASSDFIKP